MEHIARILNIWPLKLAARRFWQQRLTCVESNIRYEKDCYQNALSMQWWEEVQFSQRRLEKLNAERFMLIKWLKGAQ